MPSRHVVAELLLLWLGAIDGHRNAQLQQLQKMLTVHRRSSIH